MRCEIASRKRRVCPDLECEHLTLFQLDFSIAQFFTEFEEIGGSRKKVFDFVIKLFVRCILLVCERVTRKFVIAEPLFFRNIDFPPRRDIPGLYHVVRNSL